MPVVIGQVNSGEEIVSTGAPVAAISATVSLKASQNGLTISNEGASALVVLTLPTAVANLRFTFIVQDTDGIKVTANTGDTINLAGTVSAAAGTAQATAIGATLTLVAINATEWIATSINGTWTVT